MTHANDASAFANPAMNPFPHIHALFVGQPKSITDARGTWLSSIYRDPVKGPVQARPGGIVGDKVAQPYHGGPDADICVHLLDHYRFWNAHYCLYLDFDPVYAEQMQQMQGLADWWKELANERRTNLRDHWTMTMKE